MIFALLFLANVTAADPLCQEVRDVMFEFGATVEEVDSVVGRCEAINNPELKDQNDA